MQIISSIEQERLINELNREFKIYPELKEWLKNEDLDAINKFETNKRQPNLIWLILWISDIYPEVNYGYELPKELFINLVIKHFLNIPDDVKVIGESCFENTSIKNLPLPRNLETIRKNAFYNADIKHIYFQENSKLHTIEDEAFNMLATPKIFLPKSLKYIGNLVFNHSSVTDIDYEGNKEEWEMIEKSPLWNRQSVLLRVNCSDGILEV